MWITSSQKTMEVVMIQITSKLCAFHVIQGRQ